MPGSGRLRTTESVPPPLSRPPSDHVTIANGRSKKIGKWPEEIGGKRPEAEGKGRPRGKLSGEAAAEIGVENLSSFLPPSLPACSPLFPFSSPSSAAARRFGFGGNGGDRLHKSPHNQTRGKGGRGGRSKPRGGASLKRGLPSLSFTPPPYSSGNHGPSLMSLKHRRPPLLLPPKYRLAGLLPSPHG